MLKISRFFGILVKSDKKIHEHEKIQKSPKIRMQKHKLKVMQNTLTYVHISDAKYSYLCTH